MKHLTLITFVLLSGCASIPETDVTAPPAVEIIGHEDGMLVRKSTIKITFRISEELNGVFVHGILAKRGGGRYWCEIPVHWDFTPILITHVDEDKIEVLKTFKLRAKGGDSLI